MPTHNTARRAFSAGGLCFIHWPVPIIRRRRRRRIIMMIGKTWDVRSTEWLTHALNRYISIESRI